MRIECITRIVLSLEPDSAYLEEIRKRYFPSQKQLDPADALAFAIYNPAFGWHLINAYARARKALPEIVESRLLRRFYKFLLFKGNDILSATVFAMAHPDNWAEQTILNALLCTTLGYEEIGKLTGYSGQIIEMYAQLLFDFPDRRHDELFKTRVLNPTLAIGTKLHLNDPQERARYLMNVGHEKGPEAVFKEVRRLSRNEISDEAELLRNAKREIINSAAMKVKFGELTTDCPEFELLQTILTAHAKQQSTPPPALEGPEAMSLTSAWQTMVKNFTTNQVAKHLAAAKDNATAEDSVVGPGGTNQSLSPPGGALKQS